MSLRNRLAGETSPYLLQHAENPVDWYPWGQQALDRAVKEDKPILLSIGYSACHWCHVMAHESFDDPKIAAVMNELFINIKVDREERPDLDKIYQSAHYLLVQRGGGWPLTVFLTPNDQVPFFAGTYFPPVQRHGQMAFDDLCRQVAQAYRSQPDAIRAQNERVMAALSAIDRSPPIPDAVNLTDSPARAFSGQAGKLFDQVNGGFGQAPKFPHPPNLERLLRQWALKGDEQALHMGLHTLRKMALGGVYDQLGGGFFRYSVDAHWAIPHFEKMLYDNALLLALYGQAWVATSDRLYHGVAVETGQWVMDEMQSPDGGYYSSLDADSGGIEGKYYTWEPEELVKLLTTEEYPVFAERYGLQGEPNFGGRWHLNVRRDVPALSARMNLGRDKVAGVLSSAHERLFSRRTQRVRPGCDKKELCAWNALMVRGMAIAGRHLQRWEFIASADRALASIQANQWSDGRLLASYKDGKAHLSAYLDDYAFLMDALLEYLQADWRTEYLTWAWELADSLLVHFEDEENGGFFFTPRDHEHLIHRSRTFTDDAIASGNGVAAKVLLRLGHLLGESRYIDAAERTLRAAWQGMENSPTNHGAMLTALEEWLNPVEIIVIRGDAEEMDSWLERTDRAYAPRRLVYGIPDDEPNLPAALARRVAPEQGVLAYICHGTQCEPPMADLNALRPRLNDMEAVLTPKETQ